jgi:hypothetical protein
MNLERFDDAIAVPNATVARDPSHPQRHLLLSQVFRLGDEDRARKECELSLKLGARTQHYLRLCKIGRFRNGEPSSCPHFH